MVIEVSEYDKYNNPELGGNKPKVEVPNKYEAYRQKQEQSGKQDVIEGRSMQEYTPTGIMSENDNHGQVALGQDLNETRAHYQSGTENIFSGLAKGTGLLGTTLANTFIGLPLGIAKASYHGLENNNLSKAEVVSDIYDNEVTRSMEKFNDSMEKWFPNYYSEKEQKASATSWDNIGSSNFWGDKVLKNTGFTAGAILGGGLISKGIRGSALLAKIIVGANELTEGGLLTAFNGLIASGETPMAALQKLGTGARALNAGAAIATSTIVAAGEASGESLESKKKTRELLDEQWKTQNPGKELDESTIALHNDLASKAGNATFGVNMALLMGTETFQFGKLWAKGFTPEIARAEKLGLNAVKDVIVKQPKLLSRIGKGLLEYGENGLAESFEEGAQTATQAATKDYYGRIYDKDAIADNSRATHAILAGLQETFGTKDGIESMLLGAITGVGSHTATRGVSYLLGKAKGIPSDDETAQVLATQMNSQFQSKLPFLHAGIRSSSINKEQEANAASPNPNRVIHENLSHDNLKALVQPFIEADRFDILEDKLNNELQKSDEQFKEDNPDVDTRKTSKEYVSKIIKDARQLKSNWEDISDTFPKLSIPIKTKLWSLVSDIQNKNDRIKDLNLQVFAKSGVNFSKENPVEDYLKQIEAAYNRGDITEKEVQQAKDITSLSQEKDKAVEDRIDLANNPETQDKLEEEDTKAKEEVADIPVDENGKVDAQAPQNSEVVDNPTEGEIVEPAPISDDLAPNNDQTTISEKDVRAEVDRQLNQGTPSESIISQLKEGLENAIATNNPTNEAIFNKIIAELERDPTEDNNKESEFESTDSLFDENQESKEEKTQPTQEDIEAKQAEDAAKDSTEYSESNPMSHTSLRTTGNHDKFIENNTISGLRFQNFINNPENNVEGSGFKLMVVTPASSLYTKLLNKKQRDHHETNPIKPESILAVVVDSNNNLVVTDTSGRGDGSKRISLEEYEKSDADVDNIEQGILVTTLVSKVEGGEDTYDKVSYRNFAKKNGLDVKQATEANAKDSNTEFGNKWQEHLREVAQTRADITSGKIKYLSINSTSSGIFQNSGKNAVKTPIPGLFDVDINSDKLQFYTSTIPSIGSKTHEEVGDKLGVKPQQLRIGRPHIIYNGRVYPLQTRQLTSSEVGNVIQILDAIKEADNAGNQKVVDSLKYEVKQIVYIDPNTINSVLTRELDGKALEQYLKTKFRQVDTKKLQSNVSGNYEFSSVKNGKVNNKKGKQTYRDFLMSGDNPVLTANFRPHPTTVKDSANPNFKNGYIEYNPEYILEEPKIEAKSEESKQVTVEEAVKEIANESKEVEQEPLVLEQSTTKTERDVIAERKARLTARAKTPISVDFSKTTKKGKGLGRNNTLQSTINKENITQAKKWFEDRFDGESFEVVNSLINGNLFGEYTQAATRLFSGSEEGTVYHEAFHKVTQEYLSNKEVQSLYAAVRKNVNNKFTDLQAEEWLAEEFRKFVLNGQKAIKNMPYTNNIFRKLYNWVKSLITGKTTPQQVFDKLASKKGYTGAKKFNNHQFTKLERAIPGLTHKQTKDILDTVNSSFFNILFQSSDENGERLTPQQLFGKNAGKYFNGIYNAVKRDMFNTYLGIEEDYLDGLYSKEEFEAIRQHYKLALTKQQDVVTAHKELLKSVGINVITKTTDKATQDELELDREDSEEAIKDDSTGRSKAEWTNANEENTISGAPNSIKMLVMSLPKIDEDGEVVTNNIGGVALNDFNNTMKLLYSNLNGLSTFSEMYNKLQDISVRFPVFRELLKRLGEPNSNKSQAQHLLENDFRQAFHKFESRGVLTLVNPKTGEVYTVDANANQLRDRIQENWTGNLRGLANNPDSYIERREDGNLAIKESFVEDFGNKETSKNYKGMFEALGITFTGLDKQGVQDIEGISNIANTVFNYVSKAINKGETVNDLFAKNIDIKGQLNKLLDVEQTLNTSTIELSYLNAENKRIYAVSLNSYMTLLAAKINKAKSLDELYTDAPYLNSPYSQRSQWKKALFDKNGKKIPGRSMYINTLAGAKLQDNNDSGVSATGMETSDKIMQEFNNLLTNGYISFRRAGDKSTEFSPGVNIYANGQKLLIPLDSIPDKGVDTPEVRRVFMDYFLDELDRIRSFRGLKDSEGKWIKEPVGKNIEVYNKNADNFSLFKDMLTSETLKAIEPYKDSTDELSSDLEAKIGDEITTYLAQYAKQLKDKWRENNLFALPIKEGGFTGVSPTIAKTEEQLNRAFKCFAINHMIGMTEQAKMISGDPAFFKDVFKRLSKDTSTKKFAASDKNQDNWFNGFYKNIVGRADKKIADGIVRAVIFGDVKAFSQYIEAYVDSLQKSGMSKEKAQSILDAYAVWNPKTGMYEANMDEGDAQGWITLDEYREFLMRVGAAYWTEEHEKQYRYERALEAQDKGEELTDWMNKALEAGNPNFYFMPIKAQYSGPQKMNDIFAPAFHKYSLAPLYHSLVKGRNIESLLDSMKAGKVGYALFGSGSKVGTILQDNGKLPAFYTADGEMNTIDDSTPIQEIYYENLGIQLDIAPKVKDKNIFGSQFRKLLFSNSLVEGANSIFQKLHDEYRKLIDEGVRSEFDKLVKKLGIKAKLDVKGNISDWTFNGDYRKLVNELKKQLEDKDTADNILDSLQVNEDGSLVYPIDGMINRAKIESMLFSIVNSKVIKQKTLGNALVQLASSGFEDKGKREVGTSNYLKFYSQGKQISATDKVIFGHPTIGKTFLKDGGEDKFISLDDDYAQDIKDFIAANKKSTEDKYQYQERKPQEFIDFTLQLFDKAKERAIAENKQLFTSNNILLDKRRNEFDKVVDLDRKEFFKRIAERKTTYDVKAWKDQIDALVAKVDPNKVIKTSGYLSDLLKEGTTTAMQVEIPMNATFAPLLQKYKTIDALNEAISKGEVDSKMLTMIGYRIPTQGLNSMDFMTIKRFLPESSGIAIVLPTEVVAKSGGDYDIDKLNVFMPHISYDERYDSLAYSEYYTDNDKEDKKAGRQNRILEIATEVLSHPDNFNELITPNSVAILKDAVANIRNAEGRGSDKLTSTQEFRADYIMEQFDSFLGGKAALGIAATHNTHHILCQAAKVEFNATVPFKHNHTIYKEMVADREIQGTVENNNQDDVKYIEKEVSRINLGGTLTQDGVKINDVINQFINAYVDVAKDPFYKDLNAGTEVASIWQYMVRIGMDVNTVAYFMTQPIIKEYVKAVKLNKSLMVKSSGRVRSKKKVSDRTRTTKLDEEQQLKYKLGFLNKKESLTIYEQKEKSRIEREIKAINYYLSTQSIAEELIEKYGVNTKLTTPDFAYVGINKKLLSYITEGSKKGEYSREFREAQTQLLKAFLDIEKQSQELTSLMQDTNNDTSKLQNYGTILERKNIARKVRSSKIIPAGTSESIKAQTIVGSFDIMDTQEKMFDELTLYTQKEDIRETLDGILNNKIAEAKATGKKIDVSKEHTKLQNDFIGYITQKFGKTIKGEPLISKMSLFTDQYTTPISSEYITSKKNIFSVTTLQDADKKAVAKSSIATQFIGHGEGLGNSSTEHYRKQAGELSNTGNYSKDDVIFVSVSGNRGNEVIRKQEQDKTIKEAIEAIEAGATLLTDNKAYVDSNKYNSGEQRLAAIFEDKGYKYSEITVDGQLIGTWTKAGQTKTASSLANQLVELRKEGVDDIVNNPFINELVAGINGNTNAISNIRLFSRRMTAHESNVYTEAFRQLLGSNEPRIRDFGMDLVYLSILQSGLNNSPITFTELLPFEVYSNIAKQAIDNSEGKLDLEDFLKAYEHKQESKAGFRLQDFGLDKNAPTISDEEAKNDVELPTQEDSPIETGNSNEDEVGNTVSYVQEEPETRAEVVSNNSIEFNSQGKPINSTFSFTTPKHFYGYNSPESFHTVTTNNQGVATRVEVDGEDHLGNRENYNWGNFDLYLPKPEDNNTSTKTNLFNSEDKDIKKGSVVDYNGNKYILWNISSEGRAQLIDYETGTKFTGTPNISKLTSLGAYKTVNYNNTEYIVVAEDYIYSTASGNLVYTGEDNSSKVQREKIFELTKDSNTPKVFQAGANQKAIQQVNEISDKEEENGDTTKNCKV